MSPSAERSAGPTARSGTSCSDWSNLYRPEKTFRKMSMSVGDDICAGSRSATSCAMGKLSVWSLASNSDAVGAGFLSGPTSTTSTRPINATATPALPGKKRRNRERERGDGATGSDSEDHLAGALAAGDHRQRCRGLRKGDACGDERLDLPRLIEVHQLLGGRTDQLRRTPRVKAPMQPDD